MAMATQLEKYAIIKDRAIASIVSIPLYHSTPSVTQKTLHIGQRAISPAILYALSIKPRWCAIRTTHIETIASIHPITQQLLLLA